MDFLGISVTDWIGYLAMTMILVSFLMKNVRWLRIINSIGCVLFVIYGFLLATAWPIIIANSAIICINLYYLLVNKN